jgi:hypothetical protein
MFTLYIDTLRHEFTAYNWRVIAVWKWAIFANYRILSNIAKIAHFHSEWIRMQRIKIAICWQYSFRSIKVFLAKPRFLLSLGIHHAVWNLKSSGCFCKKKQKFNPEQITWMNYKVFWKGLWKNTIFKIVYVNHNSNVSLLILVLILHFFSYSQCIF